MKWISKIINLLLSIKDNDPVYNCDVYKNIGCSHVDDFICDMKTCNILADYKTCSTCGYRSKTSGKCTIVQPSVSKEDNDGCGEWRSRE